MGRLPMSLFERTTEALAPQKYLGAREITSFGGSAANDNVGGAVANRVAATSAGRWILPAIAFTGGLTAALIVSGLGDWLGLTG